MRILNILYRFYWFYIEINWRLKRLRSCRELLNKQYSIGVVTYFDRYQPFFKPLIKRLIHLYPDTQIIVAVNGYYNAETQKKYLIELRKFLEPHKNIGIIDFERPQSLSKLWNHLIINSQSEKIIILNDDVKISQKFRLEIERTSILKNSFGLINRSWSHFLISKSVVLKIGWFDQRFPAVGNEDEDYESRMVTLGYGIRSFNIKEIKNIIFRTKKFSYGENVNIINTKYVKENKLFFDKKWIQKDDFELNFRYVRILDKYVMLSPGMETPEFYPFKVLSTNPQTIFKDLS